MPFTGYWRSVQAQKRLLAILRDRITTVLQVPALSPPLCAALIHCMLQPCNGTCHDAPAYTSDIQRMSTIDALGWL